MARFGLGLLSLLLLVHRSPAQEKEKLREAQDCAKKIDAALKPSKAAVVSDGAFLRRATLDLAGTIPTLAETRAFLADPSPSKRREKIEALLASEAHADLWARIWCNVLFGNYSELRANVGGKNVSGSVLRKSFGEFRRWLQGQIAKDAPWPSIVAELVQATGKLSANPLVLYKTSFYAEGEAYLNFADGVSKSLLGMRISCARCHDHPFDRWTQEDYYGLAAFGIRMKAVPAPGDKETDDVEIVEEERGELTMPATSKMVRPKFLFGGTAGTNDARLSLLARLLTAKANLQLPRNAVNRVWAWLMGRGFVEPLDDFNLQNKPTHPGLLDELTREFVRSGYSLRFLFRAICNSEAYQGDSPSARPLTGEQLFQSLVTACGGGREKAGEFRDQLRTVYGADASWTEVTPLPGNTRQALFLRNGGLVDSLVRSARVEGTPEEAVENLFLGVLVRPPTEGERARYVAYVKEQGRSGLEDVLWTLLNSAEFSTRH